MYKYPKNFLKPALLAISIALLIILSACNKKEGKKTEKADESQPVMVEELSLRPLDEYITVSGKLEGLTDVTMLSETSGRILELNKKLGDPVSKGEKLGRVENDTYRYRLEQSEAQLISAQIAFDNAGNNKNYAEEAYRKELISQAEFNNYSSAFKAAKAALDGARSAVEAARTALAGSYLTAPESGVISNLAVVSGQLINPGQPIASITDAAVLLLKSGVGESQIAKLRKGQRVDVYYPGREKPVPGTLRAFGIKPLPNSALYPIEIEIPNSSRELFPGMVVSARILSTRFNALLYTSITNIVKEFDRNYVFTIGTDNIARRKEVILGAVIGENVVLASGVEAGERIVTSGTENLEDGLPVRIRQ